MASVQWSRNDDLIPVERPLLLRWATGMVALEIIAVLIWWAL